MRDEDKDKGKLLTIKVDDRWLKEIKGNICHICYIFRCIPVHVLKEKPKREVSGKTTDKSSVGYPERKPNLEKTNRKVTVQGFGSKRNTARRLKVGT